MDRGRGLLIAVEGINGAGKTTTIAGTMKSLTAIGCKTSLYKFPNRSGVCGAQIDRYLKGDDSVFKTKYDLYDAFARNKQGDADSIRDDLDAGYIVFCDRYIISGIAYHVPIDATIPTITAYYHALGYFDRDLPAPDITFLVVGDHLRNRGSAHERFHNHHNDKMMDIFHTLLAIDQAVRGTQYQIVVNKKNENDDIINTIVESLIAL